MDYLKSLLIPLTCVFLFACSTLPEKQNVSESKNLNASNNVEQANKNTEISSPEIAGKTSDLKPSPSEVFREFDRAIRTRNFDKVKYNLTKDSIAFFEEEATQKGITFKELIEQTPVGKPVEGMPEIKNEKINGDTAAVEAKVSPTANFEKLPFIKENGVWKYAFDKFIKQKMERSKYGI